MSLGGTQANEGQHAQHYEFQFNFGERPFSIQQTPVGYRPVHQWLVAEQARLRVLRHPKSSLGVGPALPVGGGGSGSDTSNHSEEKDGKAEWVLERLQKSDNLVLVSDILQLQGTLEERARGVAKLLGLN